MTKFRPIVSQKLPRCPCLLALIAIDKYGGVCYTVLIIKNLKKQ
jgi:hypothetical protein